MTREKIDHLNSKNTLHKDYSGRLMALEAVWWKKIFDVQTPYRWNLRRLRTGKTLDIGCGIGRNLKNIGANAVGVDHNKESVKIARARGHTAFDVEEFLVSPFAKPNTFDTLLLAHVAEHMTLAECEILLDSYKKYLKTGARLIVITPQELGFKSDQTHVEFMDFEKIISLESKIGATNLQQYSFPFPRFAGKFFMYNEFVSVSQFSNK